ncbi:UNVERIFIED_CONTAM: hypothetical protein Sangu_2867600 [Sesamum angustifolium]|uniref:Uncharacterized protein n=1 Tax=Sesamum angustifolium TaxID=2727405 RepID=A0AAW2IQ45_9LAMI
MQLARQDKISLEEDSMATNAITIKIGYFDGNKDSCNATHGDDTTSNEDTLLKKEDSFDADDCMSTITLTDEYLLLGSKPHNRPLFMAGYAREQKVNKILIDGDPTVNILPLRTLKELGILMDELLNSSLMIQGFNQGGESAIVESHFADAKYYIEDATKEKEVLPSKELKSYNSLSIKKNDSSAIEAELSKGLTLPLTQINMKQLSKPPLKGFVLTTQ